MLKSTWEDHVAKIVIAFLLAACSAGGSIIYSHEQKLNRLDALDGERSSTMRRLVESMDKLDSTISTLTYKLAFYEGQQKGK